MPESQAPAACAEADEELLRLELRVAKRADELSRSTHGRPALSDLESWLKAEREIIGLERIVQPVD